jgi:hypothetical protein
MAIELAVQDIVEAAMKMGWQETEALSAITEVADNLILAAGANTEIDELIERLKRDRH